MAKFREKEFSIQQKRALKTLFSRLPSVNDKTPESFLLNYVAFEAVARKVWNYSRKLKKKDAADSYASIPALSLNKALKAFGVQLNNLVVEKLLSSDLTKRGSKSARNLRNAIVHQWKKSDCDEVQLRYVDLSNDIDKFIESIKEKL
jgi:hypothetical protein